MFEIEFKNVPIQIRKSAELQIESSVRRLIRSVDESRGGFEDVSMELLTCATQLKSVMITVRALKNRPKDQKGK